MKDQYECVLMELCYINPKLESQAPFSSKVWGMGSEGGSSKSRRSGGVGASSNSGSTQGVFDGKCGDWDGVAPRCFCGVYAILYRSKTRNNPNRLFFGCPFFKQANIQHCKFFMWLDKHCVKLGLVNGLNDGAAFEDVNHHFVVIKVENGVVVLENRIEELEKRSKVKLWVIVCALVALWVAVYIIGG